MDRVKIDKKCKFLRTEKPYDELYDEGGFHHCFYNYINMLGAI